MKDLPDDVTSRQRRNFKSINVLNKHIQSSIHLFNQLIWKHFEFIEFFLKHLIFFFTKLLRTNIDSFKSFPNFMRGLFAVNTSKNLLTKSIKQSILCSSTIFDLIFIPRTNNRFFRDRPSDGINSLKVTRHASFPISIVSPIEFRWTTTPPGHSLGF